LADAPKNFTEVRGEEWKVKVYSCYSFSQGILPEVRKLVPHT